MGRPVASDVSALSSGVANSNQTMQHVSSSLSKIPYGGFSPVRLQTGSPRRPSSSITRSYLYAVQVRPSDPIAIAGIPAGLCGPTTSHWEARGSPIYSARLYPRAALRTPVDCAIAHDCYFIAHTSLRHFRIGSASTCPQNPVHCGVCNEAASFALCYGPSGLLAPPGQDFYFRAFISEDRSPRMSSITTWAYSLFP